MYVQPNFPTKKVLREALARGDTVRAFQPGPFGPDVRDGEHSAEGPHYPEPHRWYARVSVRDGTVQRLLK